MKLRNIGYLVLSVAVLTVSSACTKSCKGTQQEGNQETASVFFKSPKDGDVLTSPVTIEFGVNGMTVRPALEDVNDKKSGHHHLLIDSPTGFVEAGQAVPADERNVHYGLGETTATVVLTPGVHTLTAQFADGAHLSYGKEMANTISITVVEKEVPAEGADAQDAGADAGAEEDGAVNVE